MGNGIVNHSLYIGNVKPRWTILGGFIRDGARKKLSCVTIENTWLQEWFHSGVDNWNHGKSSKTPAWWCFSRSLQLEGVKRQLLKNLLWNCWDIRTSSFLQLVFNIPPFCGTFCKETKTFHQQYQLKSLETLETYPLINEENYVLTYQKKTMFW